MGSADQCLRRVRAARFALLDRARAGRAFAASLACRARALGEAAERPSRFSAFDAAFDRADDGFLRGRVRPFRRSLAACWRVRALAWPFTGPGSLTPARRAFDNPIAIACFVERAPCLPSRM